MAKQYKSKGSRLDFLEWMDAEYSAEFEDEDQEEPWDKREDGECLTKAEKFDESRWDFYHSDEEHQDYIDSLEQGETKEDSNCYLPSPEEIRKRKDLLNWLQLMGFSTRAIAAIMVTETLRMSDVYHLLERGWSPELIEMRLAWWIPKKEY